MSGDNELCEPVKDSVVDQYFNCISVLRPKHGQRRDLRIVYTPMHGVGHASVMRALQAGGFTQVHSVAEQAEPNGDFPTVRYPNPEESGALDLAFKLANQVDAELILANDPDVDRLAACARMPNGEWRQFTGNQIGVLLADYVLGNVSKTTRPLVAQSIVSTPMLQPIADHYGARCERTLTGFKWVWNAALEIERKEKVRFAFGFEEALGYSIGDLVRDKDGITAAVVFAELAAEESSKGSSLFQRLERLYREHGLWVSVQHTITLSPGTGMSAMRTAMEKLATLKGTQVAGRTVEEVVDFRHGGEQRPRWLPDNDLLELQLNGGRALARPSGTEPKFKIYVDLRVDLAPGEDTWAREKTVISEAKAVGQELAKIMGV
jgi:phosphomannomutase